MEMGGLFMGASAAAGATGLGACAVFLFRVISPRLYALIIAFCAGMMAFASIEMLTEAHIMGSNKVAFPGLLAGLAFFSLLDRLLPHAHLALAGTEITPGRHRAALLMGAMILHNIPEGFAIAAAFADSSRLGWLVTMSIALQDIPEGLVVSIPVACAGGLAKRSFQLGLMSGLVEFAAALGGFLFLRTIAPVTSWALAFAAGTMTYVAFFELLPDALKPEHRQAGLVCFVAGLGLAYGLAAMLGF